MFGQTAANLYTGSLGTLSRCLSAIVSCKKKYGETCRSESVGEGTREFTGYPSIPATSATEGGPLRGEDVAEWRV